MKRYLPVLLLLAILSGACSPAVSSQPEAATASAPGPAVSPYPAGETTPAGAYPPPATQPAAAAYPYPGAEAGVETQSLPTQGPEPIPDSASGVVKGRILLRGKPLHDVTFYLAKIIKDDTGQESVASFSRINSPRAYPDADGNFAFAGIEPGEYSFVVDFVLGNVLLGSANGRGPMIFAVEAGKTLDLGTLDYPDLAIPNQ